jgi:hypothetical protein
MTSPKDGIFRSLVVQYGAQILGLCLAVGAFASTVEAWKRETVREIDVVRMTARAELDAAVRFRVQETDQIKREQAEMREQMRKVLESLANLEKGQDRLLIDADYTKRSVNMLTSAIEKHMDDQERRRP